MKAMNTSYFKVIAPPVIVSLNVSKKMDASKVAKYAVAPSFPPKPLNVSEPAVNISPAKTPTVITDRASDTNKLLTIPANEPQ